MANVKEELIVTAEAADSEATGNLKHFEVLSAIDMKEHSKPKGKNNYISWSDIWGALKKIYPNAYYEVVRQPNGLPYVYDPQTGYMVFTNMTIENVTHSMWLPVMDYNNNAMKAEPYTVVAKDKYGNDKSKDVAAATMTDINKAIMRCLVKNIAMFGLGLFGIYADEDLPEEDGGANDYLPPNMQPQGADRQTQQNVLPPPPPPKSAPAKAVAPSASQEPTAPSAPASVKYQFPGDGKSIIVSNRDEPLVFKTTDDYSEEKFIKMGKSKFTLTDAAFASANVVNISVRDALNTLMNTKNTKALEVLAKMLDELDFSKPEESSLPPQDKATLYAVSCILCKTLSNEVEPF